MNTKQLLIAAACMATTFTACKDKKDDPTPVTTVTSESVSGNVSGTWTKGNTYKITGTIIVPAGQTLIIEEGVNIIFNDSVVKPEVIVQGNFYCNGTAANPVNFTVPAEWKASHPFGALWGGFICGPTCNEFLLNYGIVEYGGGVLTDASISVKLGLYKAAAGQVDPAIYFPTIGGKFVVTNSIIRNFNEDGIYLEGGQAIIANNKIYTEGSANGDAIDIKSGVVADVAFNLIYSPLTNGLKLSNTGTRIPQAYVIGYNNTIVNAGWRRGTAKGGSVWLEKTVRAEIYNNLLINNRFGVQRDPANPEDTRSVVSNTFYYGYTQTAVTQFQPSATGGAVIAGTNDVISTTVGANDPMLVNYPMSTDVNNSAFNTSWDFHLKAGSPALGKGTTNFTRNYASGLTLNGANYPSPAPATQIGAYGTN